MNEFTLKEVQSVSDALDIAFVRNSGREYMTHDTGSISIAEQVDWYHDTYMRERRNNRMFAFGGYTGITPIAYGLVRLMDEDYWITGVISEAYRGDGHGEALFRFLSKFTLEHLSNRVMLDVQQSNERAVNLYKKLGYEALTVVENDRLIMSLDRGSYREPATTDV